MVEETYELGPGYAPNKTVRFGYSFGFDIRTTPSHNPESNGMAETFEKKFKRANKKGAF